MNEIFVVSLIVLARTTTAIVGTAF